MAGGPTFSFVDGDDHDRSIGTMEHFSGDRAKECRLQSASSALADDQQVGDR